MVVAGGEWQLPIIRKAKSMGLHVINTNPYEGSLGFTVADIGLMADVLDKAKNLEYAQQYQPDAIITDQSDIAVPTVAYVCEQLGIAGIGLEKAQAFTNKWIMREFCLQHGFPTPAYKLCSEVSEAINFSSEYGYPFVIKPPASQSSRGVSKVSNHAALESAFNAAKSFSSDGQVLLEEYIGGTEFTVDGIKTNSQHYCLATSVKSHYAHNEMVANQLMFTQSHSDFDFDKLHVQHNALIRDMALPFGLTHAEYKYHEGQYYLIEVAARGGGTNVSSHIVPLMSGIDSNALLIQMALGEKIATIQPTFPDVVCVLDFMQFKPGRVSKVAGIDAVNSLYGVMDIGFNFQVGDMIQTPEDDRARHGYVIAQASTVENMTMLLAQIKNIIKVAYD